MRLAWAGEPPAPIAAAVASQSALGLGGGARGIAAAGVELGGEEIRSESSATALEVAEPGEPLEPERVEVVAGEQRAGRGRLARDTRGSP